MQGIFLRARIIGSFIAAASIIESPGKRRGRDQRVLRAMFPTFPDQGN
jgi:hypothetical protein